MSESGYSSPAEDVESPRSVVMAASNGRFGRCRKNYVAKDDGKKNRYYLHSQVLRIKEEELQIREYSMCEFGIHNINYVPLVQSLRDVWSRAILPASPLGANNNY